MALSYSEFKDYLVTFLWKVNDQQLISSLDTLIHMADNKLNRELDVERRHAGTVLLAVTEEDVDLPADYYAIRSVVDVTDDRRGEFKYVTPAELKATRTRVQSLIWDPIYSLEHNKILFVGPSTEAPKDIGINYKIRLPDFKTTDQSWMTDDFLDLYVYATLYHSAPFLREDERVQFWQMMYNEALASALEESAHAQTRGIDAPVPLPRQASPNRYRGLYSRR